MSVGQHPAPAQTPLESALASLQAAMDESHRADRELRYTEASRAGLIRLYGGRPLDPAQAAVLSDLDARIERLRRWK